MRMLTIDPGRNCGWCHGPLEGQHISGVLKLTHKQKSGRDLTLLNWLVETIRGNAITDVYLEKPIIPRQTSFDAVISMCGYATIVGLASAMTGANARMVDMQTWRSQVGSPTQAPRAIKGTNERRKWLKAATIDYLARVYQIVVEDDNEADAIGIFVAARIAKRRPMDEPGFDFNTDLRI